MRVSSVSILSSFYKLKLKGTALKTLNHPIDPKKNKIRKARFELMDIALLLDKYDLVIE